MIKMGPKTLNEYHAAAFGFCKWSERWVGNNPMRSVERIKGLGDPKRKRRAFTSSELCRLVDLSGQRGIVYLVAAVTGLRRGELAKLEWRDVHIDEAQPYIHVRSSIAKNAKSVAQPLPLKVAEALRRCRLGDVAPHELVFKRLIPEMNRFRADLAAAGIAYVDEKGQFADFHSLRKTFATELAKSQLPLRVAMELMRHSDPNLTTKIYTDAGLLPTWDAVGALPMFSDTQIDTQKVVAGSQSGSLSVTNDEIGGYLLNNGNEPFSSLESTFVAKSPQREESAPCRNRTCNPLIKSQLLCQLS
jgi:integrase